MILILKHVKGKIFEITSEVDIEDERNLEF